MSPWIMYSLMAVSVAVLFGEPLLKAGMAKLAEVGARQATHRKTRPVVENEDEAASTPEDLQALREQAFHAAETLVAYYSKKGDSAAADAAREAGRLLFGPERQAAAEPETAAKAGPRKRGG